MEFITDWMQQYPQYSGWLVFTITFVESFAFIGALVPGVVILFAASAIISSTGALDLWTLIVIAGCASSTANILSFLIGYRLKDRIRHVGWLERHQTWIASGERFIDRWGVLSVVLGRFVGPIRPFIAFVAGGLAMPPRRFVILDLMTVLIWAPVYIVPGYLTGLAVEELIPYLTKDSPALLLSLIGAAALLLFSLGNWTLQSQPAWMRRWADALGADELPIASLVVTLLAGYGLFWLASHQPLSFDQTIRIGFQQVASPEGMSVFGLIVDLTKTDLLLLAAAMWVVLFLCQGFYSQAGLIAIALISPWLLMSQLSTEHAEMALPVCLATIIMGMLAGLFNESVYRARRWQLYMAVGLLLWLLLFSRLYTGHQSFSSVMTGMAWGAMLNGLGRILYSFLRHRPYPWNQAAILMLGFQLSIFGLIAVGYYASIE